MRVEIGREISSQPILDGAAKEGEGYIYGIFFEDGKRYVGQTRTSLRIRLMGHRNAKTELAQHMKVCGYVMRALQIVPLDQMDEREVHYMKVLNSIYPNGFNMFIGSIRNHVACEETKRRMRASIGANWKDLEFVRLHSGIHAPSYGYKASEETRRKLSESHMGKMTGAQHYASKAVFKVSPDTGEILDRYESGLIAGKQNGIKGNTVNACCLGLKVTVGGYLWVRDTPDADTQITKMMQRYKNRGRATIRPVRWIKSDGTVMEFDSLRGCSVASGISSPIICMACKTGKTIQGNHFEYMEEKR